jgi:hypothetical protein
MRGRFPFLKGGEGRGGGLRVAQVHQGLSGSSSRGVGGWSCVWGEGADERVLYCSSCRPAAWKRGCCKVTGVTTSARSQRGRKAARTENLSQRGPFRRARHGVRHSTTCGYACLEPPQEGGGRFADSSGMKLSFRCPHGHTIQTCPHPPSAGSHCLPHRRRAAAPAAQERGDDGGDAAGGAVGVAVWAQLAGRADRVSRYDAAASRQGMGLVGVRGWW